MKLKSCIYKLISIGIFISIALCFASEFIENINIMVLTVLILYLCILLYAGINFENRLILLMFQIAIVVFLLGSVFFSFFEGKGCGFEEKFPKTICFTVMFLLFLSQLFLLMGYLFMENRKISRRNIEKNNSSKHDKYEVIRKKTSAILLLMCMLPKFLTEMEKVIYVQAKGYLNLYLDFSSSLPYIIIKMSQVYEIFFWLFLFSNPSKKKTYIVLVSNIFLSALCFGYGKRTPILMSTLMTIIYLIWRNKKEGTNKWINYKILGLMIMMLPVILAGLQMFTYMRMELQSTSNSVSEYIRDFFSDSSITVLCNGIKYENAFPKGNYTFGSLWTCMVRNNSVICTVFGLKPLANQTLEMALYGHTFGQTLTYLVMPWAFFSGGGMGSSYIAELFYDYSYFGVVIGNFLLGILIFKLDNIRPSDSKTIQVIMMLIIENIILLPRDGTFSFIYNVFTPTNIILLLIFELIVKLLAKKNAKY
ncbi:MAG: O-antigen polysaccharide polymerase Wzy family protein [Malacoplasma sp.]